MDVAVQVLLLLRRQRAAIVQKHVRIARNAGQRCTQVVRDGAQQIRPQRFLLHAHLHAPPILGEDDLLGSLAAFVQDGQQKVLLESPEVLLPVDVVHRDAGYSEHSVLRMDGQVQALRIGERVGSGSGTLVVRRRPCGDRGLFGRCERAGTGIAAQRPRDVVHHGLRKTTVDAQAVHDHRAVQQLDDLLGRKPEALVRIAGTLQLSAGFQQHFHAIRTARGALGLTLHADGQR